VWAELPLSERSAYIGAAVRNGLRTMPEIRNAYYEFACGGNLYRKGGGLSAEA